MTFVYNGKYLEYFEVGRTELLRSVGLTYNEIEKNGFQLPLIEAGLKYKTPATYDDLLEVEATVTALYSPKVHIEYTIRKEGTDTVVCEGFTTHIFMRAETKRKNKRTYKRHCHLWYLHHCRPVYRVHNSSVLYPCN
jgi:acyl-CoA thioester hydrolase